jgi:hypothetical protein
MNRSLILGACFIGGFVAIILCIPLIGSAAPSVTTGGVSPIAAPQRSN